ncbi:MAG: DUF2723 domain-containing protein [Elusimicrobia bacterium]|nr:DUF2723 domain-containing protein [Elusimicrobiota bacterium]
MGELLVIFLGSFAWTLWNMAPFLTVGDSGEFIVAGAVLGVAHAPGYPLYVLLEKLAQTAFPGNAAYRSNLLSALSIAAAWSAFWYFWRRRLNCSRIAAGAVLVALAMSKLFMVVGTETEVFALLAAAGIITFLAFESGRVLAGAFLFGLFMGNHHTLVLLVPAVAALAMAALRPQKNARRIIRYFIGCIVAGALGLSVYGYLPIAANRAPVFNWGNPTTIKRFWHVLSRKDYGSTTLTVEGANRRNAASYWAQTRRFFQGLSHDVPAGFIGLMGILGIVAWVVSGQGALALALGLGFIFSGPFFLFLGNPPFDAQTSGALERFFLLPLLCLAIAAPAALDMVKRRLGSWGGIFFVLLAVLTAAGVAQALGDAQAPWRRRWDVLVYDFAKNILRGIPPKGYFLMEGGDDPMYATAYMLFVERRRPDLGSSDHPRELHAADRAGLVYPSLYGFDFRTTPRSRREKLREAFERRLAAEHQLVYQTLKLGLVEPAKLLPLGIVQWRQGESKVQSPKSKAQNQDKGKFFFWPFYSLRGLDGPPRRHYRERAMVPYYYFARGQTWAWAGKPLRTARDWKMAKVKGGDALWVNLNVHLESGEMAARLVEEGQYAGALAMSAVAQEAAPQEPSYAVNSCVILERLNRKEEALACYERAQERFPNYGLLYKNWGVTLLGIGRRAEARENFQRYYDLTGDRQALGWMSRL